MINPILPIIDKEMEDLRVFVTFSKIIQLMSCKWQDSTQAWLSPNFTTITRSHPIFPLSLSPVKVDDLSYNLYSGKLALNKNISSALSSLEMHFNTHGIFKIRLKSL